MIAYFIAPYKRDTNAGHPSRYCAMDDFTAALKTDNGFSQEENPILWSETEILGNRAIVKVKGSQTMLNTIASTPGFQKIPLSQLDESLSVLSGGQRTAIRNAVLNAGYTLQEINNRFPDLSAVTLGDVLRFMASRRLKPRYDAETDTIICDGEVQECKPIDLLDKEL